MKKKKVIELEDWDNHIFFVIRAMVFGSLIGYLIDKYLFVIILLR